MSDFLTRLRTHDDLARHGYAPPLGIPGVGDPVLTARCSQGCRLLRVWAHEEGWHVVLDGGRLPLNDWAALNNLPDDVEAGRFMFDRRELSGSSHVVARDPSTWRSAAVMCGCRHGGGLADVAPIADALTDLLARRRRPDAKPVLLHVIRASTC